MKEKCFDEISYYRYADGEATGGERDALSRHLGECAHCRRFVEKIEEENRLLGRSFTAEAPEPDMESFMSALDAGQERRTPRWSLAAAAVILLGLLISLVLHFDSPQPEPGSRDKVMVRSAQVQGQEASAHIFNSNESDATYIWLAKQGW